VKKWFLLMFLLPLPAFAQDKAFNLSVPQELVQTGLIDYILPRFSLKTGVRITITDNAETALGDAGTPVFKGPERLWHLSPVDAPAAVRFQDWLLSDIGKRTIEAFEADGTAPFSADVTEAVVEAAVQIEGDAVAGKALSLKKCGRCHVVAAENRMDAIGSSPSFALMRTFDDWQRRFEDFYVLRPHPAFTQVTGITPPFDPSLPSPIEPIVVAEEDIQAILAYVATVPPADLGAPIHSQ